MKISEIIIKEFKRFTDLTINNISQSIKVVLVVGPNGSGKSSLFDAFLHWYRYKAHRSWTSDDYYVKKGSNVENTQNAVSIKFHDLSKYDENTIKGKFYFRTAYRNDADFTISSLKRQNDPISSIRFDNLIQNDAVVKENYERLV